LRDLVYYGWIVVAITFVTGLVSAGIRSAPAVFITPLEAEFGWNRAAIAGAVSISLVIFGIAAPISGRLIDRFGARTVMLGSMSMMAIGVAGTIFMSSLWQLNLLWGVIVGFAAGAAGSVLTASVASRWFVARRGLVLGILSGATATGQLIFLPVLMAVVVNEGWRTGSTLLAACALVMLVPIFFLMRDDPAQVGQLPYGAKPDQAANAQADRVTVPFSQVIRAPEFWLLAGAFFTCGGTANGLVGTHFIPHSIEHGIPEVTAAATVGVMGAMNFVGTMASGYLTDKTNPRRLLAMFYACRGLSLFILPFVTDFSGLFIFAVIYGLDWFATVPPTVALTAQRFGRRSVGSVYGWIFLSHQLGAAVSAFGGGAIRVWLGDYQMAFLAGGVLAMLGACMALLVRTEQPQAPQLAGSPAAA
jgi:sugar phosphate permease